MYGAILGARKSVYWETYILVDDEAGNRFVDAMCEKAKLGLDVKLVVDAMGSINLSRLAEMRLRASGVKFVWFNRLSPGIYLREWFRRVWYRSHRKVLIIDEEIAFVGGVNVRQSSAEWYDLHVRLTGRTVRHFLYGFAKDYIYAGGNRKEVRHLLYPKLASRLDEWREQARAIVHAPFLAGNRAPFRRLYHQALEFAKTSFTLVTPYYVPDRDFLRLISKAKARGVDVDIILPMRPDMRLMQFMNKQFYLATIEAGAKIHLLRRMNHAKGVSVDHSVGVIGSANMNPRSLSINQEAGVIFTEERMVNELNSILDDWKDESVALDKQDLQRKGWVDRIKSWWADKIKDYV